MLRCNFDRLCTMTNGLVMRGQVVVVMLFRALVLSRWITSFVESDRLPTNRLEINRLPGFTLIIDEALCRLSDVRIKAAGKSLISGDDEDENVFSLPARPAGGCMTSPVSSL